VAPIILLALVVGGCWLIQKKYEPIDPKAAAIADAQEMGQTAGNIVTDTHDKSKSISTADISAEDRAYELVLKAYDKAAIYDAHAALALMTEAVALQPNVSDYRSAHGEMEMALGHYPAALADYRRAVELEPTWPDFRRRAALVMAEMGDQAAARAELDEILEAFPAFLAARLRRAAMHLAVGDIAGARTDLDAGIAGGISAEDDSPSVDGRSKLAQMFMCRGSLRSLVDRDKAALQDFSRAAKYAERQGDLRLATAVANARLAQMPLTEVLAWEYEQTDSPILTLIEVYRGRVPAETPIRQMSDHRYFERRMDLTLIHYYLAEWFFSHQRLDEARLHFQATLDEGVPYFCEFGFAKLRLSELTESTIGSMNVPTP
jgi:tetratricopeptide (TPR) repeat protein